MSGPFDRSGLAGWWPGPARVFCDVMDRILTFPDHAMRAQLPKWGAAASDALKPAEPWKRNPSFRIA
ncbi:hypothetical protein GCM10010207_09120 [Streptomyces atratus]|nr:hypothetical protein GCM10010207_09120 [Streptomyces atratus]